MIRAFIFDLDGVIVDSEPLHFELNKIIMKEFGVELTDADILPYVGVTNGQMWAEFKDRYQLDVSLDELLAEQFARKKELFTGRDLQPVKGINELLVDLKKNGIAIALASSSLREFIDLILHKLQIYEYFQVIVSGGEVRNSKPAPDIFLKAAARLHVAPVDCVVLEDSKHGVEAAKRAGMKCIGFQNPNSGPQDLSPADKIVHTLENLNYRDI